MLNIQKRVSYHAFLIYCPFCLVILILAGCDFATHDSHKHDGREVKAQIEHVQKTNSGMLTVALTPEDPSPAPVGQYHNWLISLVDVDSNPVPDASIAVTGGMPAHGHGLPTDPQVTEYLGEGRYLLEGMKFSMSGTWLIQVHVLADGKRDTVDFDVVVSH